MIQPGQSNASLFPVAVGAGELLVVEIVISSGPRQTAWSTLADAGRRWPTLADAGRLRSWTAKSLIFLRVGALTKS
jgi:hypothetical protein